MSESKNAVIMIPYANLDSMQGGVNLSRAGRFDVYMKNCCVSLLSTKKANPSVDVACVTNIDIPNPYRKILSDNGILIISTPFNAFRFSEDYKWGLAFFKLCALKYVVEHFEYDYYSYLDSDVYVQASFENIWRECDDNILLYDINHGLQVKDYRNMLAELQSFLQTTQIVTHYGGEFFAANRQNAKYFVEEAHKIYHQMLEGNFCTTIGDEFILSAVAHSNRNLVRNAGAYIFRFWTGSFHLVSTCYQYNPVVILHVPDEKTRGMLKIYRYYTVHQQLPSTRRVWRILRVGHQTFTRKMLIAVKQVAKKILKR